MRIMPHGQAAPKPAGDKELQALHAQLRDQRVKLDSQLVSNNLMKADEVRQACAQLDGMTPDERREFITTTWGPMYLDRVLPILLQIEMTEEAIRIQKLPPAIEPQPASGDEPVPPASL